eukprot:4849879-Pyramimonas_sp.AAC.1
MGPSAPRGPRCAGAHRRGPDDILSCTSSDIQDHLGNVWADFFARLGSGMHQVPDVYVKAERAQHCGRPGRSPATSPQTGPKYGAEVIDFAA